MDNVSFLVVMVVITALAFDFTNGFHDTANAMATSIATGALSPKAAVTIAGGLNLVGAFLSTEVAKTISGGIVDDQLVTPEMVFAGLVGAILWNLLTWLLGLPSSSSHALFGGLIGAVWVGAGADGVNAGKVVEKILIPALASPVIAGAAAMTATYFAYRITRRSNQEHTRRGFKAGQIASASLVSLAHGTNDAQKTMGVITLTLIASGTLPSGAGPPFWVIASAGLAIALGTYLGGWRIVRTMGKGLTDIESPQGFAAETAATAVILTSSHMGFALSTTQVCSGGILGSGLGRKLAAIRWSIAGRMALAWLFTVPSAAMVGAVAAQAATRGSFGVFMIAVLAIAAAVGMYVMSKKNPVHSANVNDHHEVPLRPADTSQDKVLAGV